MTRPAWGVVVAAIGLFALVAQTLLLRTFLGSFEGNELGIGCFFASWLVWVALGALAARIAVRRMAVTLPRLASLALLYLPASLVQDLVLTEARALAGVTAYEVFPLAGMLVVSLAGNAPVSFLTGALFTLACRALPAHRLAPAHIYLVESLGGFAGGLGVTLALVGGVSAEAIWLLADATLAGAVAFSAVVRSGSTLSRRAAACIPLTCLLGALLLGGSSSWAAWRDRSVWAHLLPPEAWNSRFTTAQATYLLGEREGQLLVMSWGSVSETLPDRAHASEVTALTMAQVPQAHHVLVTGPDSLAICRQFAALPQVEQVAWLHPDPEYPPALWERLPEELRTGGEKIVLPGIDLRQALRTADRPFDLVVLNLPDVTTLVLNRYVTVELFRQIAGALAPGGVLAVRTSGGANFLGSELVTLGASAYATLREVFGQVVLKPGDESWLMASHGGKLTTSPAELRDRWASIVGAAAVYPPAGLLSLYTPDRIRFQIEKYTRAIDSLGLQRLINTEASPKALLYTLAVSLRHAGFSNVAQGIDVVTRTGAWIAAAAILIYLLVRLVYLTRRPGTVTFSPAPGRLFDTSFLIFSVGLAGLATNLILVFRYQSAYGTLYLHAGLIFSLFMLGLCGGAWLTQRALSRRGGAGPYSGETDPRSSTEPRALLPLVLVASLAVLAGVACLGETAPAALFALLIVLAGMVTGAPFPIATARLRAAGQDAGKAGARLEMLDHLGGAAGAVLSGLILLPIFGMRTTLVLIIALVAANLVLELVPARWRLQAGNRSAPAGRLRAAGYLVFGVAALAVFSSDLVARARARHEGEILEEAARELTSPATLQPQTASLVDGTQISYFKASDDSGRLLGYVFSTSRLAADINGYNGPIVLAVSVNDEGRLLAHRIIHSGETPAYLARLQDWRKQLISRKLFDAGPFQGIDTVSGATLSSRAIMQTLREAGRRFAREVLNRPQREDAAGSPPAPHRPWFLPDRSFLVLSLLVVLAILLRFTTRPWRRRLVLFASLALAGLWLNLQFSTQQVVTLLSLGITPTCLNGALFLTLVVPLIVILVGNVYCGSICPFGALQELIGDLRPRSLRPDPGPEVWSIGRFVKYALAALLVVLFALTRDAHVLMSDPLITFFSRAGRGWGWILGGLALASAFFYRRFWCRNICPAGAFLALLNGVRLLRRLMPRALPGRCDLGVRRSRELDCIQCDRCRHEAL